MNCIAQKAKILFSSAALLAVLLAPAQPSHGAAVPEAAMEQGETQAAPKAAPKFQTNCPVMGGKIDPDLYVDHEGQRIYLCCKGCEAAVKKDPKAYIEKLEAEGVTVAKVQTLCPIMGTKIDPALYVDHDGKRVYVCCQGCLGAVQRDAAKVIEKMEGEGIVLETVKTNGENENPKSAKPHRH